MPSRRQFLESLVASSACFSIAACTPRAFNSPSLTLRKDLFAQGVASGDPRPNSIVLWTRIDGALLDLAETDKLNVEIELSESKGFSELIIKGQAHTSASSDFTLRFLATNLKPDTTYYYRFVVEKKWRSPIGTSKTAPDINNTRAINFAWASCQDYEAGFYLGLRHLLEQHQQADKQDKLDFVLHMGDFIYESINARFTDGFNKSHLSAQGYLVDQDNRERKISPLPSGGKKGRYGGRAAITLEDYRHIYRSYLSDPDLQAARANLPFICIWDDHEFGDNSWQDATWEGVDPDLHAAATQAWFEYIPVVYQAEAIANQLLHERAQFDTKDKQAARTTLYRNLQFGRHIDLVISDNRLYRSEHLIPEDWKKQHFDRQPLAKTKALLAELDQPNKEEHTIEINGRDYPRPAKARPVTMLGDKQKQWWQTQIQESSASWKIWANSVPFTSVKLNPERNCDTATIQSDDAWDGYPSEKQELLDFVADKKIKNLISLSGDFHANLASRIRHKDALIHEFVIGALSSVSLFRILKLITPKDSQRADHLFGQQGQAAKHFNQTLAQNHCEAASQSIDYVNASTNGYGLVRASANSFKVEFIEFNGLYDNAITSEPRSEPFHIKGSE